MILIVFVCIFFLISLFFLKLADTIENHGTNFSGYILTHIKGTARGSMGKFESNGMLEAKRRNVSKIAKF